MARKLLFLLPLLSLAATYEPSSVTPPKPMRELRGVWVATVANLDWPSTNATTSAQQKAELLTILDRAVQLKLNTIIFQVRPCCDAMYASAVEPWSEYLTGTMGRAPEPFYDPLTFAIEEAHKRGLELHAWFNPYRARHILIRSTVSPNHIVRRRPDLVRKIGDYLWLDPGDREVQDYTLRVVMDVVRRYDIDGVHFDDYFYPYKGMGDKDQDFPDEQSWRRYGAATKLSRDDWRRDNVNQLMQRVYGSIKSAKPWVKFGISPFGIWRPNNPPQIKGSDAYAQIFADSRLWLSKGWVDYFAPQLYWQIRSPEQSFPILLKWWSGQNSRKRLLCPGLNTYNAGRSWPDDEIIEQIKLARKQSGVSGQIHWRASSLVQNTSLDNILLREVYTSPALVPATPWLGSSSMPKPTLIAGTTENGSKFRFDWKTPGLERPRLWLLQTRIAGAWNTRVLPGTQTSEAWRGKPPEIFAITAVDRTGSLGRSCAIQIRNSR
jgi:uncharacterized lipoprotein YddW (UPF0748 family)